MGCSGVVNSGAPWMKAHLTVRLATLSIPNMGLISEIRRYPADLLASTRAIEEAPLKGRLPSEP